MSIKLRGHVDYAHKRGHQFNGAVREGRGGGGIRPTRMFVTRKTVFLPHQKWFLVQTIICTRNVMQCAYYKCTLLNYYR